MATLSVWTFPDAGGAKRAESTLATLAARELITVDDAAMLAWPEGKPRPRTRQLQNLACTACVGDAFWGLLFGMVFYLPLLTDAVDPDVSPSSGSLAEVGISDEMITQLRARVGVGTSALFVLAAADVIARLDTELADQDPVLVRAELTETQETALRQVFAV